MNDQATTAVDPGRVRFGALSAVVGFLVFVELASGVIQGFYTPLLTDIARYFGVPDADVNWLEGGQAMEVTPEYLEAKRVRLRGRHDAEFE